MRRIISLLFPLIIFLFLTFLIFRPYFLSHKIPLPGNLLVAFYEPWKSYPLPHYPNGPANKPIGFDSLRIFYPFRELTTNYLKSVHLPLWNPYTFSGNMYLAAYQTAVFSPVDLFFFLFPILDGWSLMVILAPFFTALATYWFLRSLSISRKASIIGALTFGFSGIVVAFTEEWYIASYGILFLPLLLLAIYKLYQKISVKYFLLFLACSSRSILSGWFQITFYSFAFALAWIIFLTFQNKNKKWLWFIVLSFLTSLLVCSVYLVPNIQAYFYSARSSTDAKYIFDMYLLPISRLITYIIPDYWGNPATYNYFGDGFYQEKILYVGIVGILFGIYALLKRIQLPKISSFFLLSWIIFLSLAFSLPTSWFILYYLHIPLLQTLVPSRIIIMAAFCLAVMSAYGFEVYWKERKLREILCICLAFAALFPIGWVGAVYYKIFYPTKDFFLVAIRNSFLPLLFLLFLSLFLFIDSKFLKPYKKISYVIFFLFTIIPLYLFANKYLYFSEKQFTFPEVPVLQKLQQVEGNDRMVSFGKGYIETNLTVPYHLYSVEGYDSFFIDRYGQLVASTANGGKLTKDIARANVNFSIPGTLQEISQKKALLKIWSLLGVKYLVAKVSPVDTTFLQTDPQKHFSLLWTDGVYAIYVNNDAFPRAFLVSKSISTKTSQKILDDLYSPTTHLSQIVILEKEVKNSLNDNHFNGSAKITSYTPEKVVVITTSNADSFLVLSDNYYPGWHAYVDGKEKEIMRADFSLKAVSIPKGTHQVIFAFQPLSFMIGLWMTMGGFILTVSICFYSIINALARR